MEHAAKIPTLIAFSGLPGVGKTTLAQALALHLGATYLRIDEIEQALHASGLNSRQVGESGYLVAYALAESNLRLRVRVVADSVNALQITREAWRCVAERAAARIVEVEVICSDKAEHRKRVDSRAGDMAGMNLPSWQEISDRPYGAWDREHIIIDTSHRAAAESSIELVQRIGASGV